MLLRPVWLRLTNHQDRTVAADVFVFAAVPNAFATVHIFQKVGIGRIDFDFMALAANFHKTSNQKIYL